jgi:hypothetical protein
VKGVVIAGDAYKLLKEGLIALSKEFEAIGNFMTPRCSPKRCFCCW